MSGLRTPYERLTPRIQAIALYPEGAEEVDFFDWADVVEWCEEHPYIWLDFGTTYSNAPYKKRQLFRQWGKETMVVKSYEHQYIDDVRRCRMFIASLPPAGEPHPDLEPYRDN